MHGKYLIKVIREQGNRTDHLYEYAGATHPVCGDRVKFADESLLVNAVCHVLKSALDGSGTYYSLGYVEVKVY